MNAPRKAEIHNRLLEEHERIIAEWKDHGDTAGPGGDWDMRDREERAAQISNETVDRQIVEDNRNLLHKVDFALQRLEAGSYEQCAQCGQNIPIERLTAKPSVSHFYRTVKTVSNPKPRQEKHFNHAKLLKIHGSLTYVSIANGDTKRFHVPADRQCGKVAKGSALKVVKGSALVKVKGSALDIGQSRFSVSVS